MADTYYDKKQKKKQPKKQQAPSAGSGMAEKARKTLKNRGKQIEDILNATR